MGKNLFNSTRWIQIALINFSVVALAGITLRYKINFPLPFFNQKNVLHAHSHFAFTGWVTLVLIALLVNYLQQQKIKTNYNKYHWLLLANCIVAYGMLISFTVEGYAFYSILFSTLSIFISYFFIFYYWQDLSKVKDNSYAPTWFKAALILWAFSSLGAFSLAFLMANHINVQELYFGSIYFFLHFQYNGWFLFVCFGLFFSFLAQKKIALLDSINKKIFLMMAITVVPTYFLSILWLKLPFSLYVIAGFSGILQMFVLFYFIKLLILLKGNIIQNFTSKYLLILASTAFIIKIILQLLSAIPYLSNYAFSYRPIVIGYLHLSFLGIISFFILAYINEVLIAQGRRLSKTGVLIFTSGVILQEIVLMIQGLEAMEFKPLPYANLILFFLAIVIGIGISYIALTMDKLSTRL
ncbi:hypothetical protein AAKU52_001167 [Pedobacter sp. CG_S7]|uniref:hypothetical protein n=1 Tax=Pedobacter sp. CG_S7 TaxID=3143930 RepID=UPI0033975099